MDSGTARRREHHRRRVWEELTPECPLPGLALAAHEPQSARRGQELLRSGGSRSRIRESLAALWVSAGTRPGRGGRNFAHLGTPKPWQTVRLLAWPFHDS
jgi:hypothetical protein